MHEQQEPNYMTIGELADKVGVTVRTIQYYDQENLLKPSAKGSRNQRLYTEKDEEKQKELLLWYFPLLKETADFMADFAVEGIIDQCSQFIASPEENYMLDVFSPITVNTPLGRYEVTVEPEYELLKNTTYERGDKNYQFVASIVIE